MCGFQQVLSGQYDCAEVWVQGADLGFIHLNGRIVYGEKDVKDRKGYIEGRYAFSLI